MKIDNIEQTRELLVNILFMFSDLDNIKKQLEVQINSKEDETQDYLHELELAKLNGIEIMRVAKNLIETRKERRKLKDRLELINTLKGYADKYITKGIVADTKQAITNVDTLKKNQETREYTAKVVKDLKCAKKVK